LVLFFVLAAVLPSPHFISRVAQRVSLRRTAGSALPCACAAVASLSRCLAAGSSALRLLPLARTPQFTLSFYALHARTWRIFHTAAPLHTPRGYTRVLALTKLRLPPTLAVPPRCYSAVNRYRVLARAYRSDVTAHINQQIFRDDKTTMASFVCAFVYVATTTGTQTSCIMAGALVTRICGERRVLSHCSASSLSKSSPAFRWRNGDNQAGDIRHR